MASKSRLSRLIIIVVTVIVTSTIGISVMNYMERPSSNQKFADYFERDNRTDVLFLGTSAVTYGINPVRLWESHNITSYNFGINGGTIPESYWSLMMALKYKTPKLVVIDCYSLGMDLKMIESYAHELFDAFPISGVKLAAARDLTDNDPVKLGEYFLEFLIYHERWKELGAPAGQNAQGLKDNSALVKGGVTIKQLEVRGANSPDLSPEDVIEDETVSMVYLERMIQECRDRGIEVLLMYSFVKNDVENVRAANTAARIASKYDVNYINFLDKDLLSYTIHMGDLENHLNIAGNYRITDYLGAYIRDSYGIGGDYDESLRAKWDELALCQRKADIEAFEKADNAGTALVIAMDGNYGVYIEFDADSDLYRDDDMKRYLRGIGIEKDLVVKEERNYALIGADGQLMECGLVEEESEGDIMVAIYDEGGSMIAQRAFESELVLSTVAVE